MAQENRQQQKQLSELQVLTSGWPQHLKPEERHYMVVWMLAQVLRVYTFMKERGMVTNHTAKEMPNYLNVLQTDPTTIPTGNDFYSSMTMLLFKSWDLRSAFMERYGGSAGVPLYTDESTPVPKSHIRTSPASPQWQRKLELPLRIVLACINASTDYTATTRLTVLWKTLTIMQPQADDGFHEDCIAWARLFYFQENDKFIGKLEVVEDLAKIMEGPLSMTPQSSHCGRKSGMSWCGAISMSWTVRSRRLSKSSKARQSPQERALPRENHPSTGRTL